MDELKNTEERNDPKKSAGWPFSKELTEAWERLEDRTREQPGLHLLVALLLGYLLQVIPFRSLLVLTVKLCLLLARPVVFVVCALQLAKYVSKRSNSAAVT
jgi:hypothetical protein